MMARLATIQEQLTQDESEDGDDEKLDNNPPAPASTVATGPLPVASGKKVKRSHRCLWVPAVIVASLGITVTLLLKYTGVCEIDPATNATVHSFFGILPHACRLAFKL
jgi:hypothetical protein